MLKLKKSSPWIAWGIFGIVLLVSTGGLLLDLAGCPPAQSIFETDFSFGLHLSQILIIVIPSLLYSFLGAMMISYRRANRIGWILLMFGFSIIMSSFLLDYGTCAYKQILDLPGGITALWLFNVFTILFGALLFLFINLFPNGQFLSSRWRRFALLLLGNLSLFNILSIIWPGQLLSDLPDLLSELQNPYALPINPSPFWNTFIAQGKILSGLIFGLFSILSLVNRWRQAQGEVRQQIKWLALFIMTAGTLFVSIEFIGYTIYPPIFEGWPYLLNLTIFFLGLPIVLGVAILKYRLYDIDIIINRTLVYGGMSVGIVAIYVLVVAGLGAIFQSQGSIVLALLATGLIAVLFQPVRDRLQQRVNRLMFGERDDPYTVLSKLSTQLQTSATPEATLQSTVETVAETLKLPYVAIELADEEGVLGGAVTGKPIGEKIEIPLRYQNEMVGRLVVSPRSPGESFNEKEQRLLTNIAAQTGPMAHAVRLTAILQRSREKLVLTREEERRRIRRDLHDELGPTLASQTFAFDAILDLLDTDPGEAARLLKGLKSRNQETVGDIRRLVYELRPPALDELGLTGALEAHITNLNGRAKLPVSISTSPAPLPPLSAAVEVAAYRIALEAISNVVRHARANQCQVQLNVVENGRSYLRLTIRDNGIGLPEKPNHGLGLHSMRERAEELGGWLTVTNQQIGTMVTAEIPLPTTNKKKNHE